MDLPFSSVTSSDHSSSGRNLPSMSLNISPATSVASCQAASSSRRSSPTVSGLGRTPCMWKKYRGMPSQSESGTLVPFNGPAKLKRPYLSGKWRSAAKHVAPAVEHKRSPCDRAVAPVDLASEEIGGLVA